MDFSTPLYDVKSIKEIEANVALTHEISSLTLMQRAALFTLQHIYQKYPSVKKIGVLAGVGKNGGDGYFFAQQALSAGYDVRIYYLSDPNSLVDDIKKAYLAAKGMGVVCRPFTAISFEDVDLIVDALLGTGVNHALSGEWLGAVMAINRSECPVVSIDVPSGLDADTGNVFTEAVKATSTVTFVGRKPGLYTGKGAEYAGEIYFSDLGIPQSCYQKVVANSCFFNLPTMKNWFPKRQKFDHKGNFGRLLVIGGNVGMAGAALLTGYAALRTGAGLVTVATHPQHVNAMIPYRPELMIHGVSEASDLDKLISNATCIVIGCGLGTDKWAQSLLSKALEYEKPMVLDADALNLIAYEKIDRAMLDEHRAHHIITPHVMEASRLLKKEVNEVEADRLGSAQALSDEFGTAVLKGSGSLVCDSDILSVNTTGNPAMATAGMGDVLSGIIAGLIVQGVPVRRAARLGVWLHGSAGDICAEEGRHSIIATDVIENLHIAIRQLTNEI